MKSHYVGYMNSSILIHYIRHIHRPLYKEGSHNLRVKYSAIFVYWFGPSWQELSDVIYRIIILNPYYKGKEMVDYIADYLENIRQRRVFPDVKPGYIRSLVPERAPELGEDWDAIFADVERVVMPGVSRPRPTHFQNKLSLSRHSL